MAAQYDLDRDCQKKVIDFVDEMLLQFENQ